LFFARSFFGFHLRHDERQERGHDPLHIGRFVSFG
jgi:hypothetical protein